MWENEEKTYLADDYQDKNVSVKIVKVIQSYADTIKRLSGRKGKQAMHIMIFDVPAESGGALSMLHEVYEEALANEDKTIKWTFVVSKPDLKETENIKVLRFPWIKRSWIHRLYFDNFVAPKIVKRNKVDYVLSLQNITVPSVNCGQVLYVHQSLPFVDHKFSFRENKKLWIYQNVIGKRL